MTLAWICIGIWAIACLMLIVGFIAAMRHFTWESPYAEPKLGYFPISILKPLRGIDFELEQNLEDFFNADYPTYELLFSVNSEDDPAYAIASKLIKKYPNIDAKIVISPDRGFGNPKISNLIKTYPMAKYDWIMVCDSNMFMEKDYLKKYVRHVDEKTGMVAANIAGFQSIGFAGRLESVALNSFNMRWPIMAKLLGEPCGVGKAMMIRKNLFQQIGGVDAFSHYIAEDLLMGRAVRKLGYELVITHIGVRQRVGRIPFKQFWDRHKRWGRIRKRQAPFTFFILEPLVVIPFTSACIGAFGFYSLFEIPKITFVAAYMLFAGILDFILMRRIDPASGLETFAAWFVRELLHVPLWIHIACGNSVKWRGRKFFIEKGGKVRAQKKDTKKP